jgi:hypothetical protein
MGNLHLASFMPIALMIGVLIFSIFKTNTIKDSKMANAIILKNLIWYAVLPNSLFFFLGHIFNSKQVAKSIGWGCGGGGFQKEVAFASFIYVVGAIYSMFNQNINTFKTIAILNSSWLAGTVIVHLEDMIKNNNLSFNNIVAAPLGSVINIVTLLYLTFSS